MFCYIPLHAEVRSVPPDAPSPNNHNIWGICNPRAVPEYTEGVLHLGMPPSGSDSAGYTKQRIAQISTYRCSRADLVTPVAEPIVLLHRAAGKPMHYINSSGYCSAQSMQTPRVQEQIQLCYTCVYRCKGRHKSGAGVRI